MREREYEGEIEGGRAHCHLVYYFWKFCAKVDYNFSVAKQAAPVSECAQLQQQPPLHPPYPVPSTVCPCFCSTLPSPAQLFTYDFYSISVWTEVFEAPPSSDRLPLPVGKGREGQGGGAVQRQCAQVGSPLLYGLCPFLAVALFQHFMQISYVSFMPL